MPVNSTSMCGTTTTTYVWPKGKKTGFPQYMNYKMPNINLVLSVFFWKQPKKGSDVCQTIFLDFSFPAIDISISTKVASWSKTGTLCNTSL